MAFQADNSADLITTLQSSLARFTEPDASVRIIDTEGPKVAGRARDGLIFRLPAEKYSKQVRESWDEDRKTVPDTGVVFPDSSVMLLDCLEHLQLGLRRLKEEIFPRARDWQRFSKRALYESFITDYTD